MSNETDNVPLEVMAPSAMMSIERAQIDSQVATAKQYPRELMKFKQRAVSMATLDGDTAESCVYCRPVGKGDDGKQKYAEGPSIRMAEIVATCYGNIRVSARIVEQTPRYVKCEGAAHDLETNFAAKSEVVESTVDRNGRPYSERQAALMAKVAVAKAFRDAVFKVVPRALMKPVLVECKKVIAKEAPTIAERLKRIQAWIGTLKIDVKRVFAILNVSDWSQFTEEQFDTLTGLKTAIADGDRIDDVFPPLESVNGHESKPNAPAATGHQQSQQPAANTVAGTGTASAATAKTEPKKEAAKPKAVAEPAKTTKAPPADNIVKMPEGEAQAADAAADEAERKELAEMGLGPVVEEPAETKEAPAAAEPAPDAKADKPEFKPKDGETPELTEVRRMLYEDDITEDQFLVFAQKFKMSKPGQKLPDLATKVHKDIIIAWPKLVAKVKASIAPAA